MAETQDIIGLLDSIIKRYSPGGGFGEAEKALLGREKTKAMASGQQRLVSAGLSGTTVGAGMEQRWEEERGMPARLQLEDTRTQRLTEAMGAKAGYLERAEARAQQLEQTEMGALAQVHAAKYGTSGGDRSAKDAAFWADKPEAGPSGAPGGATQHIGQGGAYIPSYEQVGDPNAPGGSVKGKQIGSSFQPMTMQQALAQGYDYFGPGGQQILSKATAAKQEDKGTSAWAQMTDERLNMAQTAQKWLAGG